MCFVVLYLFFFSISGLLFTRSTFYLSRIHLPVLLQILGAELPSQKMVTSTYLSHLNPTTTMRKMATHSRSKGHLFYLLTLLFAMLSTALSIAILGTVAHSYHIYQIQKAMNNPWWLPLWPGHFSITGTKALIGAGAGIGLLNGLFLGGRVVDKVTRSPKNLIS